MTEFMMDQLIADFGRASTISWVNDTVFLMAYDEESRAVYSQQYIRKGSRIGYIPGDPTYIWDISHSEYMFVNDDQVIDVSELSPRPLITMIRNENDSWAPLNCVIYVEHDEDRHESTVAMYAYEEIYPGDEMVYGMERPWF